MDYTWFSHLGLEMDVKIFKYRPARTFRVGTQSNIEIRHTADIELNADEQVTFRADSGSEYDIVRKAWGYYATPSLNGRLQEKGLRGALVRNRSGKYYLLLVEKGQESGFYSYLDVENHTLVSWLDTDEAITALTSSGAAPASHSALCPLCGSSHMCVRLKYDRPPDGETKFPSLSAHYPRYYLRCEGCGLFIGRISGDLSRLYSGEYVGATYGEKFKATYERIMNLPPERSDNIQRVAAINAFWQRHRGRIEGDNSSPSVLDIGSGLCVFLARMKEHGWVCTALDPDPTAVRHARECVGVEAIEGVFGEVPMTGRYDLISLNKVLEHVPNPVRMLAQCSDYLREGGLIYVEVPDGEMAIREGAHREEFFIEHLWVFSAAAVALLAQRAGFCVAHLERVHEPSSKYTVRAFLFRAGDNVAERTWLDRSV